MSKYLTEGLLSEMNRAKDLITEYNALPGGIGFTAASLMKKDIQDAEKAISTGDIMEMLMCYKRLRNYDLTSFNLGSLEAARNKRPH